MNKDDIKKMDTSLLRKEVFRLKKELFNLKLSISGGQVKDFSQFKKLRSDVARCLTFLNQKTEKSK